MIIGYRVLRVMSVATSGGSKNRQRCSNSSRVESHCQRAHWEFQLGTLTSRLGILEWSVRELPTPGGGLFGGAAILRAVVTVACGFHGSCIFSRSSGTENTVRIMCTFSGGNII